MIRLLSRPARPLAAAWLFLLAAGWLTARGGEPLDLSPRLEAQAARRRGAAFLLAAQRPDGSWSGHAGVTAVCLMALLKGPPPDGLAERVAAARAYLRQRARPDGSFSQGQAPADDIYVTAVCTMALTMLGQAEDRPLIAAARAALMRSGVRSGFEYSGQGSGYPQASYPDLSNTHWALEALYLSRPRGDTAPGDDETRFWRQAARLLRDCQVPGAAPAGGGFVYYPIASAAGAEFRHGDLPRRQAWGSLTCGAVKSLRYAQVPGTDADLLRAGAWLKGHYSATENPGLKDGGYYYYLYMLASAALVGGELLEPAAHWRRDLVEALLQRQRSAGEWRNADPLWLESDPNLCTAYALLALSLVLEQ